MGIINEVKFWNGVLTEDEFDQASKPALVKPRGKIAAV